MRAGAADALRRLIADKAGFSDKLMQSAEQLGAKAVTQDRGRQMDGGFGTLAIQVDRRVSSPEEILRIITPAK